MVFILNILNIVNNNSVSKYSQQAGRPFCFYGQKYKLLQFLMATWSSKIKIRLWEKHRGRLTRTFKSV